MKSDRFSYIVLIIFIVLFGLRLIHISADPPTNLSWSGGLFFDEGALAHNARNKVLFGEWKLDEWNDFYYSPILTYVKWLVFAVFGVGLVQLRLVPIGFSCLTLWGLYLALRVSLKRSTAILSVFLLGFNYIYLMYNRLGLTEIPLLFFAALTLYLWQSGLHTKNLRDGGWYMFFAGISCFTVYIFKALLIYFLPVPLVTLVFLGLFSEKKSERKRLLILIGYFIAGMTITLLFWLVLFYYPNYDPLHQAGAFVKMLGLPHSAQDFFKNVSQPPFFSIFLQTPVILILSFSYLLYLVYAVFHKPSQLEPLDIFVSLWFLAHIFFFIGYSYRPTRYYVTIIPPMSILAARGIMKIMDTSHSPLEGGFREVFSLKGRVVRKIHVPDRRISFWFWGISWLVGWILWAYIFIPLFYQYGAIPYVTVPRLSLFPKLLVGALLSFAITGFMAWWSRGYRGKAFSIPHRIELGAAVIVLFISVSVNGIQFYRWAATPQYVIRDTSRELGTLLKNAFIAGLATPMLCIENTHRALYVWENFTNYQDTLQRYKLTHLFLAEFNDEVGYYYRKFPELMQRAKLLKSFQIKGSAFHLFSVVEPSINNIIVEQIHYRANEPVVVGVEVKNNSPQQARDVEVGWLLRPYLESEPVITAKEQVSLGILAEKTITLSKNVPPGTYDVLAAFFSEEQDMYEAENLSSQVGPRHPDIHASEGEARYFGSGDPGYLVYGPYRRYSPGKYDIDFRLKCSDEQWTREEPIAVIDVSTDTGRTILARKDLRRQDFKEINTYQTFRLSFFLKASQKLEFRVFTHGRANLWADTITVAFISGEWYESPITVQEN